MAIVKIENNQIQAETIDASEKLIGQSITANKLELNINYPSQFRANSLYTTGSLTVDGLTTLNIDGGSF